MRRFGPGEVKPRRLEAERVGKTNAAGRYVTVKLKAVDAPHWGHGVDMVGRRRRSLHRSEVLVMVGTATTRLCFTGRQVQGVRGSDLLV